MVDLANMRALGHIKITDGSYRLYLCPGTYYQIDIHQKRVSKAPYELRRFLRKGWTELHRWSLEFTKGRAVWKRDR